MSLPTLAEQIAAAAADAKAAKLAHAQGVSRCPERDEVLDVASSDWHHKQREKRLAIGAPAEFRSPVTQGSYRPDNRVFNTHPHHQAFNIKGVVEALVDAGFDPTVEVVKILKGKPDPEDPENPEARIYEVPPLARLQFSAQLMNFVHPTKKAVDVNQKVELRGAELNNKLGRLLARYAEITGGVLPADVIDAAANTVRELGPLHEAEAVEDDEEADDGDFGHMI